MISRQSAFVGALLFSALACGGGLEEVSEDLPSTPTQGSLTIDQRSFRLGSIAAFAEMVGAGVKKLALSAPMAAEEMDALLEEAERIVGEQGVELYREPDFLVTDLFSAELTEGKQVLLIYRGDTAEEYLQLKAEKRNLEELGSYEGEARLDIARRMGALLSYSDAKIAAELEDQG